MTQHLTYAEIRRNAITAYRQKRLQFQQTGKSAKLDGLKACYYDARRIDPDVFHPHRNVGCAIGVSLTKETIDRIYTRYPASFGIVPIDQLLVDGVITAPDHDRELFHALQAHHDHAWRSSNPRQYEIEFCRFLRIEPNAA